MQFRGRTRVLLETLLSPSPSFSLYFFPPSFICSSFLFLFSFLFFLSLLYYFLCIDAKPRVEWHSHRENQFLWAILFLWTIIFTQSRPTIVRAGRKGFLRVHLVYKRDQAHWYANLLYLSKCVPLQHLYTRIRYGCMKNDFPVWFFRCVLLQAKSASSTTSAAQVSRLQDQADMYSRKIENEKRRIDEMDKQIEKMQVTNVKWCLYTCEVGKPFAPRQLPTGNTILTGTCVWASDTSMKVDRSYTLYCVEATRAVVSFEASLEVCDEYRSKTRKLQVLVLTWNFSIDK